MGTKRGMSCIHPACVIPDALIDAFPILHPNPCNVLVLRQLHHSCFTATLLQGNKVTAGKHLCETDASASERFAVTAPLIAPAPSQQHFFIQSRNEPVENKAQVPPGFSALTRAVYSILPLAHSRCTFLQLPL